MKLQLAALVVSALSVVGCGSIGYNAPESKPITNLNEFVKASALVQRGTSECLYVVNYVNGRSTQVKVSDTLCREAVSTVARVRGAQLAQETQRAAEAAKKAAETK